MNSIQRITLIGFLVLGPTISADTLLGIYLDYSRWTAESSGQIASLQAPINLDEIITDDDDGTVLSFKLEHPLPGLPNIGLSRTTITAGDTVSLGTTQGYANAVFTSATILNTEIDSMHEEVQLYYELLDNWVSLDLGINLIHVDDQIRLSSPDTLATSRVDEYLAGIYAMAAFEIPTTNLYVKGSLTRADMSDVELNRYLLGLGWESDWGLGFELGYRNRSVEWQNIQLADGSWDLDGYYASVRYHF